MKDGWAVANHPMLSYSFIPKNYSKPSSDKLFVSNRKGQNGTTSMEQIAIGGEIICKGAREIVVFDFNLNINDKWTI